MSRFAALIAGMLFGLGLSISQMIDPNKVIAFLNVGGDWDPSLALVLAGAVAISALGYRIAVHRERPVCAPDFQVPQNTVVDTRLLTGAAIFGVGWGLAGYCPGPAIAALALGSLEPLLFVAALIAGALAHRWVERARAE